jgi:hypothetical protein
MMEKLAHSSAETWLPILRAKGVSPNWESRYVMVISVMQPPSPSHICEGVEEDWVDDDADAEFVDDEPQAEDFDEVDFFEGDD